ncbi:protein sel-1 like protein [Vairimorpha necatrix]|uniref:Protein sel-1 like protein n=1 Tax=Vairimorpha necatrix TaxID=6039 RepID=A0AAX4JGL9_9MICR
MKILLIFLNSIFSSSLEDVVLKEGNIVKGINMLENLQSDEDYLISYILKKYFMPENESSTLNENDKILDLLMTDKYMRLVYSSLVLSSDGMYASYFYICNLVVEICRKCYFRYLENGYDFIPKVYYKNKEENYKNLLIMARNRDPKSIKLYFEYLSNKKIDLKGQISLPEYLASKGQAKAFGYLGEAYFYGVGVKKSLDRSLNYFIKGKDLGTDYISYNGIGKILMSNEYKDFHGAKEHFDVIFDSNFNETNFRLYLLYKNHFKIETYASYYLSRSVSAGYLPAIFIDGRNYYKKKDYKSALIRLEPILEYDETVMDLQNKAYEKYKNRKYMSCLMYLLMTIEMGSESSLENAIYLLENCKITKDENIRDLLDIILFRLYLKHEKTSLSYINRIGDCYYYGKGVKQSYKTAFAYYLTSGSLNNTEGLISLYFAYTQGIGTKKDMMKGYKCIKKIQINDNNYILKLYIYIIFIIRFLLNSYIIGTVLTCYITYRIYDKLIFKQ